MVCQHSPILHYKEICYCLVYFNPDLKIYLTFLDQEDCIQKINEKLDFVVGIQSLFLFNGDGNIKSMQDLRLGLGFKNTQVGIAAGLEQVGPNYMSFSNFGIFIEQSIF